MDNQSSSYSPAPPYSSHCQDTFGNTWEQCDGFRFSDNQAAPFQHTQPSFSVKPISEKGPMAQLRSQIHPSSHVRAYNPGQVRNIPSRPSRPNQTRKERPKPAQTPRTARSSKRQRVVPPLDSSVTENSNYNRCSSATGSQSECCSSCPDSPPCDEPECDQGVVTVPCYKPSCEEPVCSSPCLTTSPKGQHVISRLPTQTRTTNWIDSQWVPQIPRGMVANIDPAITGGFEDQYTSTSNSPAPTTPSMGQNLETPYSSNNTLPTPQFAGFSTHERYHNQSIGVLSGTGAGFNTSDWQNYAHEANTAYLSCLWNGCEEQSFINEQQWVSHLHNTHIDPQITFGCPIQGDSCPQTIDTNPLDHLQTDHGFNFEIYGNGFNCPAPTCPPSETFFSPSMFHNHFDFVHGIPAQGSLQCRLETCNTTFVDPQHLMSHIHEYHKVPAPLPKEDDDIDLSVSTDTANVLASLPKAAALKVEVTPTSDMDTEFSGKEIVHICNWKSDLEGVCGQVCNTEEDLQKHIKREHLEQLDKTSGYKCQWEGCNRDTRRGEKSGFSQRGKLERHMATHTGFKCCECDECGKTFSAEQSLRQHLLLHKGEKPWKSIHERTHTKEKPLECTICGKRFSESSNLSKHRKIHGEKGLNSCDFPSCGKSFHRFDQLKRHRVIHERQLAKLRGSIRGSDEVKTESEISE